MSPTGRIRVRRRVRRLRFWQKNVFCRATPPGQENGWPRAMNFFTEAPFNTIASFRKNKKFRKFEKSIEWISLLYLPEYKWIETDGTLPLEQEPSHIVNYALSALSYTMKLCRFSTSWKTLYPLEKGRRPSNGAPHFSQIEDSWTPRTLRAVSEIS